MTENNLHHKIKMNKKVILLIVTFSIIATPALAFAATPPWWVTATGAIAGGIAGTIATGGTPIGAIAGATAGALLANYIYSITQTQAKGSSGLSEAQDLQYLNSVTNSTLDTMIMQNASALTQKDLTETSYYYFAQLMDTVVPTFLPNATLNETYMGWDSGLYATLDNLSISMIYPINTILFNYVSWLTANSYPSSTATTLADYTMSVIGSQLTVGNYYFITGNNNFYFQSNMSLSLKNVVNGTISTYKYTVPEQSAYITGYNSADASSAIYSLVSNPVIVNARSLNIPTGEYEVMAISTTPLKINDDLSTAAYIYPNANIYTDAIQLTNTGSPNSNIVVSQMSTGTNGYTSAIVSNFVAGTTNIVSGSVGSVSYSQINIANIKLYLSQIYSMITDAYNSANAYFNQLKSLGYTSASQVPPSLLYVTPSVFVPTSILNSTFNATELQSLYVAYLLQLQSWLNLTSKHTLQANMTINNSTFNNGFVQVYGNLENNITSSGKVSHYYYNNTWFVPLINLDKWTFKVHSWTNITNNTPDPNFLIVSGSNSGTLVNVVNGTFYTKALTVNGTSTSSFTISPVTIQYVLPHTVSIGKLNNGGFLFSKTAGLQNWELILAGIITVIGIAIVFDRKD